MYETHELLLVVKPLDFIRFHFLNIVNKSVSYTHLDVYKRQVSRSHVGGLIVIIIKTLLRQHKYSHTH